MSAISADVHIAPIRQELDWPAIADGVVESYAKPGAQNVENRPDLLDRETPSSEIGQRDELEEIDR